jgi:hypothetical protein
VPHPACRTALFATHFGQLAAPGRLRTPCPAHALVQVASDARVRGLEAELSREAARRFSIESENAMLKMRLANAEDFRRGFLHGYRTY